MTVINNLSLINPHPSISQRGKAKCVRKQLDKQENVLAELTKSQGQIHNLLEHQFAVK